MYKKNLLIKRSQSLIYVLSKNSHTMYNDCLAVYRDQIVEDNFIVGSIDRESSQQLQMWFSEHFIAPEHDG